MATQQQTKALNHGQFAPQEDALYDSNYNSHSSPYDHVSPTSFDPRSSPAIGDHNSPPQQYTDYQLYSAAEDQKPQGLFAYDPPTPASGSINPADLSLMGGGPHQGQSHFPTPQLELKPYDSPVLHHQQDSATYTSASSTQPSATGFEWDPIISQAPAWGHRRTPSEYSVSSQAPSPYMQNQEFSDQPSPVLEPRSLSHQGSMQDLLNSGGPGDALGFEDISLQEREPPSLSHTPALRSVTNSPYLMPQTDHQMIPPIHRAMNSGPQTHMPAGHGADAPPRSEPGEFSVMSVPQIDVIFAPPQRQPTFPGRPGMASDDSALSPPPKNTPRRQRAKSDPYAADRGGLLISSSGPGSISPVGGRSRRSSLSPVDIVTAPVGSTSRSPSPSSKQNRRSSTNSMPNSSRDYILELAHPNRPGSNADNKRVQKHPATFQCHLCPKRFTRAYNLRSHLRTHTDERPFVCTICGKAFARQHDRKRHEGLHSGEKRFVCRGNLKAGGAWGCGRRFARADALGRHFRSEAGRVCIRPLLDEETAERQRNQVLMEHATMFPSAILEQYPALATVNWAVVPPDGGGDESGRSSFDASGGEQGYESYGDGDWGSDTGEGVYQHVQ